MSRFLAGASQVNVTPPVGIRLAGYGSRTQPSCGVHDELWAQALTLDDGERQVALVTVDALALPVDLVGEVRCAVEREVGLPAANVLLCAAHDHSGPDLWAADEKSVGYRAELSEKLQGVVGAAVKNQQEARVWSGKGALQEIARNRRPRGGAMDPEVGIVGVETMQGVLMAVLVNYTCHATVLGAENLCISADYPGYMRRAIERQQTPDVVVLFTNGALGNVNPGGYSPEVSMIGHYIPHRTFADAERLGTMLADEVLRVLKQPGPFAPPVVGSASAQVELCFKERPDRGQVEVNLARQQQAVAELKKAGVAAEQSEAAEIELAYASLQLSLLEALEREGPTTFAEIQAVRIGDTYLVGIPGEAFVEIGLALKRQPGLPHTLVAGLANGYLGYIPVKEAYAEGGYEPRAAKVAAGADVRILSAARSLLKELADSSPVHPEAV